MEDSLNETLAQINLDVRYRDSYCIHKPSIRNALHHDSQ